MPKVSVIIPCCNQGQYIGEAVDSVLASSFTDYEIIIVNDGSTDNSTQYYVHTAVESILQQTFPDFEFILIDNASTDQTAHILKD